MKSEFSTPLSELPTFLSTISMVVDDRAAIMQSLIQAERKSPPRYEPAKALFCRVLQGDFHVEQALDQARKLADTTERKCAIEILQASEKFLRGELQGRVGPFPSMSISLPNEVELGLSPVWLRHLDPERLMILHFWRRPLSQRQLSAAGAVLRVALSLHKPNHSSCELDFISVSLPENASQRQFRRYSWTTIKPFKEEELSRFWKPLCATWLDYQRRQPRKIKRKREPVML